MQCDFSNADLSHYKFIDCVFIESNLSMCRLDGTSFRDVEFKGCKMLGLRFDQCHAIGLSVKFVKCFLNHASFQKCRIRKTKFMDCQLEGVDFTGADLTAALFDKCKLQDAVFENTLLEMADLRSSFGIRLDPETNHLRKARFSLQELPGLLSKYDLIIDE